MTYELLNSDYKTLHEVVQDFPYYKSVKTQKRYIKLIQAQLSNYQFGK